MATRKKASKKRKSSKKKKKSATKRNTKSTRPRRRAKRKATGRRRGRPSAQRATNIVASLNKAFEDVSRQAVKNALNAVPGSTRVGKFLEDVASSPYLDIFHDLSLQEFADAVRNVPHEIAEIPRRSVAKARRQSKAAKAPGRKSSRSHNTRTAEGKAKLDDAVAAYLAKAGTASAESIRGSVGGTPPQIRAAVSRLIAGRKVKRTGQRRRTRYTWKG
jgi:hypothetical protein